MIRRERDWSLQPEFRLLPALVGRRQWVLRVGRRSWILGYHPPGWRLDLDLIDEPVLLLEEAGKRYWLYRGDLWMESEGLAADAVRALIIERTLRTARRIQRAMTIADLGTLPDPARRQSIPDSVKLIVWQRDGGRCVRCGSERELEFDHIIPVTMGGSSTEANLQVLCAACNRAKGGRLI